MKKIKFDGCRFWLYLDYSNKWCPFANYCYDKLTSIIREKYGSLEIREYEIEDPKDGIYGANHGPQVGGGVCSGAYPMNHYECDGIGVMGTFSWNFDHQ